MKKVLSVIFVLMLLAPTAAWLDHLNGDVGLTGVQLGVLNYAANNPRGLRLLPLVNVHL